MSKSAIGSVRALLAGVFATLTALSVQAAPLIYSETVSGDLSGTPNTDFAFDVGDNKIAGTTHFGVNALSRRQFDSDMDGFAFTLSTGMQLAAITLSFVTSSYNAIASNQDVHLCTGIGHCGLAPTVMLGQQTLDLFGAAPTFVTFGLGLPLGAGTYTLMTNSLGIAPIDPLNGVESWSSDYQWTISVVSVDEPAMAGLLALGVVLLFAQRRPFR